MSAFVANLTWGSRARAAAALLGKVPGPVVVLEALPLVRVLAERGLSPVLCSRRPATLRRWEGEKAEADDGPLPFADATVGAVLVTDATAWDERLPDRLRVLADDGLLVLLDGAERTEATRRALCAGLVDLVQRPAGRTHVTAGRWRRLP